ncbi:hypothetical protein [Nocardia xishanensis]|uniref:Uncharacterized protein n=1 Tax=Nocardia xishanensis TaxID=238964 RepID=A0ABW7WX93_9NOCA
MLDIRANRYLPGATAFAGTIVGASALALMLRRRPTSTGQNPPTPTPAEPSADDLDREQIEQLHRATLSASESCFELKKICATVLVPTGTLIVAITDKKLDTAVFVAGLSVITAFWLADAVGYYYQRKLRLAMDTIWTRRAARCSEPYSHVPSTAPVGILRAAFNASMLYYLILAVLVSIAFALFGAGIIG